ncbi:hypothetical protein ACS0TY_009302 [Phlomoides rotata]
MFLDLKRKGNTFVDGVTYSIVILHLCRDDQIGEALKLVKEMEGRGFVVDLVTITSLLTAMCRQGQWDWAERLMKYVREGHLVPSILKWKSVMEGSMRSPQSKKRDFTPMFPSISDVSTILNLSKSDEAKEGAKQLIMNPMNGHPLHTWICWQMSSPLIFAVVLHNLSRCLEGSESSTKGKLSLACKLFEIFTNMGVNPVSYTYNSIISSFIKKGYFKEAWGVLHAMGETVSPTDIATYNVIIQGLGKMGRADLANGVVEKLYEESGYLDIMMYNTLINALGKAGKIDEAVKLFEQMKSSGINPDVFTYNILIEVHSKGGRLKEAYKFLKMMLDAGCAPNHVTDTTLDFLGKEIERRQYQKASIMRSNVDDPS